MVEPSVPVSIPDDAVYNALNSIYHKKVSPDKDLDPTLFNAIWSGYNKATDKGISDSNAPSPADDFRAALKYNNAVFSAFKVHRLQHDVAAQLLDSNGNLKPFKQWLNDVQPIASHQCKNWFKAEYSMAVTRAHQAADWQQFEREKDILPNLEWLPSTAVHPDTEHSAYVGTILPIDDSFWNIHHPGDHWGCLCSLTSTDKPCTARPKDTDPPQPGLDNNPGKDAKLFSDTHPYIASAAEGAQKAVDKTIRALDLPQNYTEDNTYGKRLLVSKTADKTEVAENKRAAKALVASFSKMVVKINPHVIADSHKNPEYTINGLTADRKGIMSENGVTSGFKKAIAQGCKSVVIDLDMNMKNSNIRTDVLAQKIYGRHADFESGTVSSCYIIYNDKAVLVDGSVFKSNDKAGIKDKIAGIINKIAKQN